jgi:histidinol dehydrogenase
METIFTIDDNFNDFFNTLLMRGSMDIDDASKSVSKLLNDIKLHGEDALLKQIAMFDRWNPTSLDDIVVSTQSMKKAYDNLEDKVKDALHLAYDRIYAFHEKQKEKSWIDFEENGSILGQKVTPMQKAGLYIPGGKAAYPSSLLMNAIPAIVAGVKDIIVCTPTPNNEINELLLGACHICKLDKVFKVGGASAIGAMAYGCKDIPKVDVITGPGNIYVATAKKLVYGDVNIDMIAGPSEIGILADDSANAKYVAMDMLSQAEHDEMASSILITTSKDLASKVQEQIKEIIPTLSRSKIAQISIDTRSAFIVTKDMDEAIELMNDIAPEHLEIICDNEFSLLPKIKNAGAIFLGENTPEPIGDYLAGPNHTLPTGGSAKFFSPLGVEHFVKKSSIISFSKEGIKEVADACEIIAQLEGLTAHRQSVSIRR